jgi:hypothetical protein
MFPERSWADAVTQHLEMSEFDTFRYILLYYLRKGDTMFTVSVGFGIRGTPGIARPEKHKNETNAERSLGRLD